MTNSTQGRPPHLLDQFLVKDSEAHLTHLEERAQHIVFAVGNLCDEYVAERQRLADEYDKLIPKAYWYAGLYFRVVQRAIQKKEGLFSYDIVWAKGKVNQDDPAHRGIAKRSHVVTHQVHRCDTEGGTYSHKNLKSAVKGQPNFEHELAFQYETKLIRPLRADLRATSRMKLATLNLGPLPDLDGVVESLPKFDASSYVKTPRATQEV